MYEIPSQNTVREVVISEDVIYHKERPLLVYDQSTSAAVA
jgi:ATP-dependent Clp protease ATP-binding subunit ClpX